MRWLAMQVCKKQLMNIKMIKINSVSLFIPAAIPAIVLAAGLFMTSTVQAARSDMHGQEAEVYIGNENLSSAKSGPGQKFAARKSSLTLPLERKSNRSEMFSSHFHLDITEFDWRGTTAAQKEYLWLSMPIEYQQQRGGNNLFLIDFEPGLMTDGENVGIDYVGINVSVVGRRLLGNGGFWQYGLIIDRAFGDYNVRPLLGLGWQASRQTWVELGFPNINIKHGFTNALQGYFLIKPAGGVWKEEIKTPTTEDEVNLQYRNWQVGFGANFHWRSSVWLNVELGQLRNRRVLAYDETLASINGTLQQSQYWRIGASLRY
ncbi:MAG: hypothetical protein ACI9EX_002179 [Oleispira sp.]